MLSGPARALNFLQKLLPEDPPTYLVIFSLQDVNNSPSKRREVAAEQPLFLKDFVPTRVGEEIGQLQAGDVIRLWSNLKLPAS